MTPVPAGPSVDDLRKCIHCGMCLEACPTYRVTGLETESPRGRIHLMSAVALGQAAPTRDLTVHLDRCLACRACETACPSGVPYGSLIEATRASLAGRSSMAAPATLGRRAFRWLFAEPGRLHAALAVLGLYERLGLRRLVRASGLLRLLPARLRALEGVAPPAGRARFSREAGGIVLARGVTRGRVALLTGCVMRESYGDVHDATVALLARAGLEVVVPTDQACCGALAAHGGDAEGARAMARRNVAAFEDVVCDAIVVNAAGCGAHLKHYASVLADDPAWAARAAALSAKVRDLVEVLAPIADRITFGPLPLRITYQDPCHLAHAQGLRAEPRALLRRVPALELVEMREADRCCGSAGVYNVVQAGFAERILDLKMADVLATRPQAIVTANPGCVLQLRYGAERAGLDVPVYHLAELLERSARAGDALPR